MIKRFKRTRYFLLALIIMLTQILAVYPTAFADTGNLAAGKTITANNYTQTYIAANANDGNANTYWEGAPNAYPNTLTVDLGSVQSVYKVVIKLNPSTIWGRRTQTLSLLLSNDNSTYTTAAESKTYTFDPATGNTVTIIFTDTNTRYVRLNFTANSGATGGQVAEFEVYGAGTPPSGQPDLIVTDISWAPANPTAGNEVTFSATIKNQGTGATPAGVIHGVSFLVDGTQVNWSDNYTSSLAPGSSATLTASYGPNNKSTWLATAGTHTVQAWVDDVNRITNELNENNNKLDKSITVNTDGGGTPQGRYEGEKAVISGGAGINTDHTGYSGTGFVDRIQSVGAAVTFNINVSTAGYYDINLRYANAMGSTMTMSLYVNGAKKKQISLPSLANWDTWSNKVETAYLNAGANTVAYKYDAGDSGNINIDYIDITAASPKAELVVTDITWAPLNPVEGDAVTFSAVVKNQGTAATPAGTMCGVDFLVGGSKVTWSDSYTASIPVGGSVTLTANGGISGAVWAALSGQHTITAIVDSAGRIAEMDETNNSFSKSITINPRPGIDLIVTDISWTPSNPAAGAPITFSAVVKNQGTTSTPAGRAVTVGFQIDGGGTTIWSNNYTTQIAAGASATITANSGTWTALNGSHSITATVDYTNTITETKEDNNSYSKNIFIGRGASVPWIEYEAEDGATNAAVIGPNRNVGDLGGEASGRKAVKLDATGKYIEWTAAAQANSIVIRYCIPDAPGGGGINATISLYINGTHRRDITLTSKNSWLYGNEGQPTNNPGDGTPRRIYDEAQALVGDIPAGAKVRLQKDTGDTAAYYGIDFIDLEQVAPPKTKPAGYLSITDAPYNAIPNDTIDDSNAIQRCIADASQQGKGVWIPEGTFYQTNKIMAYKNVTVQGAGMWYSKLYDPTGSAGDWGNIGFNLAGADNFKVFDLALFAEGTIRDTGGKAFCYSPGANFEVGNVWIEHTNCGFWLGASIPTVGARIYNVRMRNLFADGINLCNSSRNNIVENCTARNTGDDSFAIWSATDLSSGPCEGNIIRQCTAQMPWRANCFAIYGGRNNTIEDCVGQDTLTYAGVNISSCFSPVPFSGTTTVQRVTLIRCGGAFWNNLEFGALWLNCDDSDMSGIVCRDIDIIDSRFSGLHIQSETYGHPTPHVISNTTFENINISGSGTDGIYIRAGSSGSAAFNSVKVTSSAGSALKNDAPATFTINKGSGNSGW